MKMKMKDMKMKVGMKMKMKMKEGTQVRVEYWNSTYIMTYFTYTIIH
jgi:hypothetical protein